jgi:hypothetical protein
VIALATIFTAVSAIVAVVIATRSLGIARGYRRASRGPADGVGPSVGSLFDITGAAVYGLMRQALEAKVPEGSATESFRASARTVADAYGEAVRDNEHIDG